MWDGGGGEGEWTLEGAYISMKKINILVLDKFGS